ncbi:hypothetical protein HU200_054271 [Digitaria exilis]|uniref:Uncharacterized protein n=1 Tax=Digitaria exilis TaxID=1010633 RepID=A0A835AL93_9POAL|nr:hypothetical protein HU200_054271 [Digitaria exilis]
MNYHRTHSEHVTKVAAIPHYHAGGAMQHHMAVHKESFKEVDEDCYDSCRGHGLQQQQAHRHHGDNGNNHVLALLISVDRLGVDRVGV